MISVVIPLYNKAHCIEKTINSVLCQTFQNFEIVVVNDGSTDYGPDIVSKISDSRIQLINQSNQGVSVARNTGVNGSKYDLIAFLDGDDEWLPGYLEKMVEAISLYPDAGMYCSAGIIKNADSTVDIRIAKKYKNIITQIDFFENPHVFVHTSATIVRKSDFERAKGFPPGMKRNQDFALFYSLAFITPVVYSGFPLSIYVGGISGQTTGTHFSKIIAHKINRYNYVYNNWSKSGKSSNTYLIFQRYELRHDLFNLIKRKEYIIIKTYLKDLDRELLNQFPSVEISAYKHKFLRELIMAYIIFTKIRWRLRGYPRVGEIRKVNFSQYL